MLDCHSFHVCNILPFAGEARFAVRVGEGVVALRYFGLEYGGVGESFIFSFGCFK